MWNAIRLFVATVVCGGLAGFLFREVWLGLRSGRVRYTDSTSTCSRTGNPLFFWFLVALFIAFGVLCIAAWVRLGWSVLLG